MKTITENEGNQKNEDNPKDWENENCLKNKDELHIAGIHMTLDIFSFTAKISWVALFSL